MIDLLVVVADGYQEKLMDSLLERVPLASQTRDFSYFIVKNPGKDPGSLNDSHELLRPFINQYSRALVIFDFEGCGAENLSRAEIEAKVLELLERNGWEGNSCVVVIEPELENWVWIDNPNVEEAIGWEKSESLYQWARREGLIADGESKPFRPKEAFEEALRISDTPTSASIYKKIAEKVSYKGCTDLAFLKLINQLQVWFPK